MGYKPARDRLWVDGLHRQRVPQVGQAEAERGSEFAVCDLLRDGCLRGVGTGSHRTEQVGDAISVELSRMTDGEQCRL